MMYIKLIVKIAGANQTFSRKLNLFTVHKQFFKDGWSLDMCSNVPLLLAHLAAEMLSVLRFFTIMSTKVY